MGPVFFSLPVMACWLFVHSAPFLSLTYPRLRWPVSGVGFVALQAYMWSCLGVRELAFVPVACIFFLVAALSLTGYSPLKLKRAFGLSAAAWGLAAAWTFST